MLAATTRGQPAPPLLPKSLLQHLLLRLTRNLDRWRFPLEFQALDDVDLRGDAKQAGAAPSSIVTGAATQRRCPGAKKRHPRKTPFPDRGDQHHAICR